MDEVMGGGGRGEEGGGRVMGGGGGRRGGGEEGLQNLIFQEGSSTRGNIMVETMECLILLVK